ncbi:hypothetical protein ACPL27_23665, partial [Escherichia coli]
TVLGEGTSFKVYLPRVEAAEADLPDLGQALEVVRSFSPGREPVILVVDDDAGVREVTVTRLSEAGYAIREAASGLQALAFLEGEPEVDLVV